MTTSSSKSEKVCARTESIAAPRNGSSLYVASKTVTRGATPLRYRDAHARTGNRNSLAPGSPCRTR